MAYLGTFTEIGTVDTASIADDAVTADKLANSINTEITANTAKTGITSGQASAITANTAKVTNYNQTKTDIDALGIAASSITGALPAISGASLTNLPGGGKVLQVLSATKTDRSSTTSTTFIDVPGLSLTVTPASTSSKFYLIVAVAGAGSESSGYQLGNSDWSGMKLNLLRDSTSIGVGDTGYGTQTFGACSGLGQRPYYQTLLYGGNYLDSPATTSSITYKVQYAAVNYGTTTGYINRAQGGGGGSYESAASSTITLMEIAG